MMILWLMHCTHLQPGTHISSPGGRTRPPTCLVEGKSNLPVRTATKRRHETMVAASGIHGGSENNPKPALDGLFDTLNKRCKLKSMKEYVLSNEQLTDKVVSTAYKKKKRSFENSATNVTRSIATFYSNGIMGKRKYQAVRMALTMKKSERASKKKSSICVMPKCPIPKLITYNNLVSEINKIDIGNVVSVQDYFQKATEDDMVRGCFRKLEEFLPRLAKFYLRKGGKESLKWFGNAEGTFLVALGGDGCPFGKNESACTFLVSFLNVGKRVASNNDNFIIFGANCEESSLVVKKYVQFLCQEIIDLQGKVFEIESLKVSFKFEEVPNDMKMLAMLGGELSNSAKFFSSFANVSKENCSDLKGTFGNNGKTMWRPWKYEERIAVANKVDKFKKSLSTKQLKEKQFRTKVTEFISHNKSRQEFVPLIGKLIDKAHVEPLHVKNNAWQYFFKGVLKEAIAKSNLPDTCKKFMDVPRDSPFSQLVTALKFEVKAKCLARKVIKWYDETQGNGQDLQYRFTGKESRLFCHNFMRLIKWLSNEKDSRLQRQTVLTYAYIGLRLRDCVSIFNRFDVTAEQLSQLTVVAREYFRGNALFLPSSINPTVWTIGHIIPSHTQDVYRKYGQGLGTVTMEGREAKHIALKKLSENTTFQRRWPEIFKHEFVMLIWLSEQGFEPNTYKHNAVYIPCRVFDDDRYCYCNLEKADPRESKCTFCGDPLMDMIKKSIDQGTVLLQLTC